jgi:hypothetical protein
MQKNLVKTPRTCFNGCRSLHFAYLLLTQLNHSLLFILFFNFHPNPSTTITTVTPQYSTCKIVTPKKLFLLFSPIYPHLNTKFSKKEINPTAKNNLPLQPFFSACTYTPSSKPTEFELLNIVRSCTIESLSLSLSL